MNKMTALKLKQEKKGNTRKSEKRKKPTPELLQIQIRIIHFKVLSQNTINNK